MKGWHKESHRHGLAARGITTSRYLARKVRMRPGVIGTVRGIPIVAKRLPAGQAYPISPNDVKQHLLQAKEGDMKGLTAIEFAPPRDASQKGAWAQYKRGDRKVVIFSQPAGKNGTLSGRKTENVQKLMERYVIPHELGHHKALYKYRLTDKDLRMAEARADAHVFGMDVRDRDAAMFKKLHNV